MFNKTKNYLKKKAKNVMSSGRLKAMALMLLVGCGAAMAQNSAGDYTAGTTALTQVTEEIAKYVPIVVKLCYAIAGVVAMKPKCIIFDEQTAMLDPKGRAEIMSIIDELHAEGITVILITHFMDEAVRADRVIIMHEGHILLDGTPQEVFEQEELIRSVNLDVPLMVEMGAKLRKAGIDVPRDIITEEKMVEFICQYE